MGTGLLELWSRLKSLEQSAVAEAAYEDDGIIDSGTFYAKYGSLPVFETEGKHQWQRRPSEVAMKLHRMP